MCVLACYQSWVHHCTPETRKLSSEWCGKEETTPVKVKTSLYSSKDLTTDVCDAKGVLYIDCLLEQRIKNSAYYSELWPRLERPIGPKRCKMPIPQRLDSLR